MSGWTMFFMLMPLWLMGLGFLSMLICMTFDTYDIPVLKHGPKLFGVGLICIVIAALIGGIVAVFTGPR